jgi:hypothetical protein
MTNSLRLLAYSTFINLFAFAQPTLNYNNSIPAIGSDFTYHQFSNFEPGMEGIEANWDFSNLEIDESLVLYYVSSQETPHAEIIGDATMAAESVNTYEYFLADSSVYAKVGSYIQPLLIDYSDPQDLLRFPFSYGSEFSDTFAASYQYQGYDINIDGVVNVVADGYGDLELPYGVVTDVIRVKYTSNYQEYFASGNIEDTVNYYAENYVWYKNDLTHLLSMTHLEIEGSPFDFGVYLDKNHVGIQDELAEKVELYPNPSTDFTHIEFQLTETQNVELTIHSILGKKLKSFKNEKLNSGFHKIPLNLEEFSSGTYLLKVEIDGEQTYKTISIQ